MNALASILESGKREELQGILSKAKQCGGEEIVGK